MSFVSIQLVGGESEWGIDEIRLAYVSCGNQGGGYIVVCYYYFLYI